VLLDKFKGGETRVEIEESVRGKDVFIIQSGGGKGTPLSSHPMRAQIPNLVLLVKAFRLSRAQYRE
jgi:phosphoribosylpyrophosphate synthetase